MKVIDLLNKIENGEEIPKKFKYDDEYFIYDSDKNDYVYENGNISFFTDYVTIYHLEDLQEVLNKEIELIEEKKIPEKITIRAELVGDIDNKLENLDINIMAVEDKLNQVIDYLKSKGE